MSAVSTSDGVDWTAANQRYLRAALDELQVRLATSGEERSPDETRRARVEQALAAAGDALSAPSALDRLAATFALTPFERDVLLALAGIELDAAFAEAVGPMTFGHALATLEGAHWSALSPAGALRRWRMVELGEGSTLAECALRIDERILHHLTGVRYLDERLAGLFEPVVGRSELVPSHAALADDLAATWARSEPPLPILHLRGGDAATRRAVLVATADALGLGLFAVPAALVPASADELAGVMRLWERESALSANALAVEVDDTSTEDPVRAAACQRLLDGVRGPMFLAGGARRPPRHRPVHGFDLAPPTHAEQHTLWHEALGGVGGDLNGQVDGLVAQFRLAPTALRAACSRARAESESANGKSEEGGALGPMLWRAAREQARPRLDGLATRLEPRATWDDLVLPEARRARLRELAIHVRRRFQVYERWGFGARGGRGLGVSALFSGLSGTGKTMAADVLAGDLDLDLYRIDLASIVSKYIGETEKNLRRVFDAAEDGGAILLFDEADALFGKRSEVKDSHDRFANIEIGYLLQRMEAYRGLAILTSNMKSALDTAFLRRLRFVIEFPFPDVRERDAIWRGIFPPETPTADLRFDRLARLHVAGGSIRNIALGAAFLAAEDGAPVRMEHLLEASRSELEKLEKPLNESEVRGWTS